MGGPGRGALGSRGGNARPCHVGLRMRGGRAHGCPPRRQQVREGETCARRGGERRGRKGSGGEGEARRGGRGYDRDPRRKREKERGEEVIVWLGRRKGETGGKMVGVGCVRIGGGSAPR